MTALTAQRIVRFIADDGQTYYGDAVLPAGVTDARRANQARIITGDILGDYKVEETVLPIRKLLSPLPPSKVPTVRCLGLNYKKHAAMGNVPLPEYPILFYKPSSAVAGPTDPIPVPKVAQKMGNETDYECEPVVVIGKPCRDVSAEDALDYVLGYAVGNDVSHRLWQKKGGSQWSLGKMYDGWAPFGPAIVTPEVVGDIQTQTIYTKVNGEITQQESNDDMIFPVGEVISFLSQGTTLQPGDVIFMGTPFYVRQQHPPELWLKDGDVVEIGLSNVGSIENIVEYEKPKSKA
ncbi:hypothetical protein TRVA0_017S01486 [Trichomonascus vanleenenianus]|uniref:fumarylacetoacetate hydrolase family protein n=1 Tax=Trichomonascus vanleenenianus TaxID=2268995 RepID=UPI003ECAFD27